MTGGTHSLVEASLSLLTAEVVCSSDAEDEGNNLFVDSLDGSQSDLRWLGVLDNELETLFVATTISGVSMELLPDDDLCVPTG